MKKKVLWKDIKKCFSKSKGRFFSILCLMMLGSFALVGLKVAGPDMRATGEHYFNQLNLADITVIGDYGIDDNDQKTINQVEGAACIEYGYLKDVVIKDTKTSFRVFSKTDEVSQYEIVEGSLPHTNDEIALASFYKGEYSIGDTIEFIEKADTTGETVLKKSKFKIVGFVNSSEIVSSMNLGQSTAGTGELQGYAVVDSSAFDSDVYMIARITYEDTKGVDPYSDEYTDLIQKHKEELNDLLKNQPEMRLAAIKEEYQSQIDEGQQQIADAKQQLADAEQQLEDGKQQIDDANQQVADNEAKLNTAVSDAEDQINEGQIQIQSAADQIALADTQLANASAQLASGQSTLDENWAQLQEAKELLKAAQATLSQSKTQLQNAAQAINEGWDKIAVGNSQISDKEALMQAAQKEINSKEGALKEQQAILDKKQEEFNSGSAQLTQKKQEIAAAQALIEENQSQLDSKKSQLESGKATYEAGIQNTQQNIAALEAHLKDPNLSQEERGKLEKQLTILQEGLQKLQAEYEAYIADTYTGGMASIEAGQQALNQKKQNLAAAQQEISNKESELAAAQQQLESGKQQIAAATNQLSAAKNEVAKGQEQLTQAKQTLAQNQQLLVQKEAEYNAGLQQYNGGITTYNEKLQAYYAGLGEWEKGAQTLSEKNSDYETNAARLEQAKAELEDKENELEQAKTELLTQKTEGEQKIADAKEEISEKEKEYEEKLAEFLEKKEDAEKEIEENEEKLDDAQKTLENLKKPVYALDTRREIPGSEGYLLYSSVSFIIDSLSNIFPIFMYLIAALVTLTTMTRFVDEERMNSGTLKALGYSDKDIVKKFIIYGMVSSMIGAVLGIIAGHTLLPMIIYSTYGHNFTLPELELHFQLGITIAALILALISAVLPAYLVASKEMREIPATLLLPKAPAAGSKIFLERISPIWNRMSFTHKVTARNIFRYKKRMLMTIFGVCGSVTLLFTGFSVQHSISGISDRQFGEILHYDLIVARNDYLEEQTNEIDQLLNSNDVKQQSPIYYAEMSKTAGANKDNQKIQLIVPQTSETFDDYISLSNRKTGEKLNLQDDGAIISERLAKLLGVETGDTITVSDSENKERTITVSDITEMYTGHFIFMNKEYYETVFNESYRSNANLVVLNENSEENANKKANEFMKLDGVEGVVQNTTLMNQIHTIVQSLNKIMSVLIIVAVLLAIVILYNLTNINVSERIRELSTIKVLGFYNKEVTLYIYRETIILSFFGILVGFGFGDLLYRYILAVVPPDDVMFNPVLGLNGFIIPTVTVIIITVVLGKIINRRLKNVNMLEALKSVE